VREREILFGFVRQFYCVSIKSKIIRLSTPGSQAPHPSSARNVGTDTHTAA
jgi:hypothetical protein